MDCPSLLTHNLNATRLCKVKTTLNSEYYYFKKVSLLRLYYCRLKYIDVLKVRDLTQTCWASTELEDQIDDGLGEDNDHLHHADFGVHCLLTFAPTSKGCVT